MPTVNSNRGMKHGQLTFLTIYALVVGVVAGFVAARRIVPPATQPASVRVQVTNGLRAPQIFTSKFVRTNLAAQVAPVTDALDSAEFEMRLRAMTSLPIRKRWDHLRDLARSVAAVDATNALKQAEIILPPQEWSNFRYYLLESWAETDPEAVLAYGQSLKNRND